MIYQPTRRVATFLVLATLSMMPFLRTADAQDKYPSKPVKIIIPLPAGGAADSSVRILATVAQRSLGQPMVVDNKPGGAYLIGVNAVVQAPADGYTLLHVNGGMLSVQAVFKRFDFFKQLVPVAGVGETDVVIASSGKRVFKTIKDLIAFGKANPGKLNYGSPGAGTNEHLALDTFCKAVGIEAVHVPMKGGPDVVKALVQGDVDFGTAAMPFVPQFAPGGLIRPLVVLNDKRNAITPDVPTYKEEGLPINSLIIWGGYAAPAGTPPAVVAQLEKIILEAAKNPEVQKQLTAAGMVPTSSTGAEFGKVWKEDYAWVSKAALDAKLDLN